MYGVYTHTQHTHQIKNVITNALKQLKKGKVYSSSWFEQTVNTFHHGANIPGQEPEQLITLLPRHRQEAWRLALCSAGFLLCIRSETPAGKGMLPALWVGLHTSVSTILY